MSNLSPNASGPVWPRIFGAVLTLIGLVLLIGGIRLMSLGGSWYYVFAGAATLISGVLLVRAKAEGGLLYLVVVIGTAIWSLAEVGTTFWGLVPRLAPVLVLGVIAALAMRALRPNAKNIALPAVAIQAVVLAAGAASLTTPHNVIENTARKGVDIVNDLGAVTDAKSEHNSWKYYGGDAGNQRFAAFDQINTNNVNELEVAWTYRTGAQTGGGNEDQNTPIQVGDSLYLCTPQNKVIALNAETGEEKWVFDPKTNENKWWSRCRGVAYYEVPAFQTAKKTNTAAKPAQCEARIITTDKDGRLWALDAQTGAVCQNFGDTGKGYTDLSVGMGEYQQFYYMPTSQPLVAGDRVIIGGWVWDGRQTDQPSGVVRAYSLVDGSLDWAWDLGNAEITKLPPEGQTYTRGTPNFWSNGSYDPELDLIYLPLGNATPDFWGAHRTPKMNEYATTIVAIQGKSGKEAWKFQTLYMDTWDYDNGTPPTLMDLPDGNGGVNKALVAATKTHQLFLLDRTNGKPLAEVKDLPAPKEFQEGDATSDVQPWSVGMPQVAPMDMQEKDMWGATMFDQLYCRIQYKKLRYDGPYTKLTTEPTLIYPGYYGGFNWGGHAFDPRTNMYIVNDMRMPQIGFLAPQDTAADQLAKLKAGDGGHKSGWATHLQVGTPYQSIRGAFNSFLGLPCHQPSWGNLTAIDMNTRQIAWQVPLGTVAGSKMGGVTVDVPMPIGMPSLAGPIATAGGLTFFAGSMDRYFRAFDNKTGQEVWKHRMPVGAQAAPMSYLSPESGRQFVVISAGGARMTTEKGDYVIAYALPKK
ncbi:membrane-bound PQQ-dependent dehydrogenase, glucose/quinate/shikimate family [Comamonas sp. NoAH]|uniref:membrane-bound PQQ-dependent dehydrogenase, glucose/quinate/shikimate family n=1 Tax=Comamonas halotolerans TaxID=3041496 RepID=UPI0024E0A188|nr:membrane-bound PQQ-dependent dehydrogenase, glucose/quinate/shikimate family [Comamonas sp. NoAH]